MNKATMVSTIRFSAKPDAEFMRFCFLLGGWRGSLGFRRLSPPIQEQGIAPRSVASMPPDPCQSSRPLQELDEKPGFRELLAAAKNGCRESTGVLVERFRTYLLLIANQDLDADVRPKVGASDVVQETCCAAHRSITDFRGQSESDLRRWLRHILINDLQKTRRSFHATTKRQVQREIPLSDQARSCNSLVAITQEETAPDEQALRKEEAESLRAAMDLLNPEHFQVLHLRNWLDLSFEEIGVRMERSPDAARKLWSRAVLQLQRLLNSGESSTHVRRLSS